MRFMPLLALAVLAGCATTTPKVQLAEAWPETVTDYGDAYNKWTRHANHMEEWVQIIDAYATLESTEFRAAQAHEWARRALLPEDDAAKYAAAERADAAEAWQVELVVSTAKYEWNDFRKLKAGHSMWRVALVGDDGREVLPISIVEDKREREAIRAWFPGMTPFHSAYVIRFPKLGSDGKPLVHDGARLVLKIGGPLASVEMSWGG